MSLSSEARRLKVHDLLKECCNDKLLRGGADRARKCAEDAVQFATAPDRLPSPWPELASYRLAHLLLRDPDRGSRLATIDEHLRLAAGSRGEGPLGPIPHIYRLAVLHLMLCNAKNRRQRDSIQRQIDEAFNRARDCVNKPSILAGRRSHTEHGTAEPLNSPIQHEAFNLLEFASYFLNHSYAPLTGLGGKDGLSDVLNGSWILVGPDPEISSVRMSKEFAYAELDARAANCANSLLIRLPVSGTGACWRLASSPEWQEVNDDWIRLLANLLKVPSIETKDLQRNVIGDGNSDRFRQHKTRLQKEIRQLTGRSDLVLFEAGKLKNDQLPILGAVHNDSLRWGYPRRPVDLVTPPSQRR